MAYRPYTQLVQKTPTPTGYAPGGYSYFAHKSTKPKVFGPTPTTGYAPAGVSWEPIPQAQQVGAGGAPAPGAAPTHAVAPAAPTPPADPNNPFPNDPVYQQIVGIANMKVQQAQAAATAARKQLAIEMGDPGLATSLGLGNLVAQTAQANPFSTLKNLLRGHIANADRIDTSLNHANLFSSSTRGRQQQLEGTGYLSNVAGAQASAQKMLATILSNLLGARNAAAEQKAAAASDAFGRAEKDEPQPTGAAPTTTHTATGGATGGTHNASHKASGSKAVKRYTASPRGYAPGGVAYKPIPTRARAFAALLGNAHKH